MLACRCANPQPLRMTRRLDQSLPQALLQMVPTTPQSLNITAPTAILHDPALGRLAALSHLELTLWEGYDSPTVLTVLAGLPSLARLSLHAHDLALAESDCENAQDDDVWPQTNLCATTFSYPGIACLELSHDAFDGQLKLAQLPSLQVLCVSQTSLSGWLQDQTFETLEVTSGRQIIRFDTRRLLCRRIEVVASNLNTPWQLSDFLAMPRLAEVCSSLHEQPVVPPPSPHGS